MNAIVEPFKMFNDYKHEQNYYNFRSTARTIYTNNCFAVKDIEGLILSTQKLKKMVSNIYVSVEGFNISVEFVDECAQDQKKFIKACGLTRKIVSDTLIIILQLGMQALNPTDRSYIEIGLSQGFRPVDIYCIGNSIKFNL